MASCSRNALSRSEDEAMLRRPDVDEVMEYGRALGFDLTPTEARMIQARMMDTIAALETFDEMGVKGRRPRLRFTDRDPGRRPSAAEDPLGAFITRCRVPGAASGPLHGKTVALKVDIALGGDQGGSIRLPAAWCGIVGLMPTHGLVPHSGVFGLEPTIDYVGPMARTVEDIAVSLQVMAGRDGLDLRQADVPATLPPYPAALARGVKGLRIGLLDEGFGGPGGGRGGHGGGAHPRARGRPGGAGVGAAPHPGAARAATDLSRGRQADVRHPLRRHRRQDPLSVLAHLDLRAAQAESRAGVLAEPQ